MSEELPPEQELPPEAGEEPLRSVRIRTRGRISLVWAVPIVAVLLGASLVLQTYLAKGPSIEISFPVAAGLEAGTTPIKYRDVEVGIVTEVQLESSLEGVLVVAELEPGAETYLREGTIFWLVRPRVSFAGISGIETLLSGQYIELRPSREGERRTRFEGQLDPPIAARYPNAKTVVLETARLGSIVEGTPIYHRGLRAGEVASYELGEGAEPIRVYALIDAALAPRVRETSVFWNATGIEAHLGLDGIDVRTEGLAAMLLAGIAFSSTEDGAAEAESGAHFQLHDSADAAQRSLLRAGSIAVELESRSGKGLGPGTPVYYRGLEIGYLGSSRLTGDALAVRTQAFVEPRFRPLIREGTRFYKSSGLDVSLDLEGVRVRSEALLSILRGGVSIAVPEAPSAAAEPGALFALYDEPDEAWLAWRPKGVALEGPEEAEVAHRLPPDPAAGSLDLVLVTDTLGSLGESSQLSYRGLPVGRVLGYSLGQDADSVELRVRIDAAHRRLVSSETRFFRSAGFSLDIDPGGLDLEVGSLRTLALGGIELYNPTEPGSRARNLDRFDLYPDAAAAMGELRGSEVLRVAVEAPESMLRAGAPVYFRRHPVGEVGESKLTVDGNAVRVELRIDREYASLVRSNTRFWSPSALSLQASLSGVEVEAAPLQALLAGGVMLATPTAAQEPAQEGAVFSLAASAPAGWAEWRPALSLPGGVPALFAEASSEPRGLELLLVAKEVDSIGEGDPIFYRGLQIGAVGAPRLGEDGDEVLLDARIAPEYAAVIRSGSRFWNASGLGVDLGWGGLEAELGPLETLIRGGIQVATPDPPGERASAGDRFRLGEEPAEEWRSWSPVLR